MNDAPQSEDLQRHKGFTGWIVLVEPDPSWPEEFARQRELIIAALGPRASRVEHVGSTSIPGLAAKPIIDIVLVVADPADERAYVPDLEAAGFGFRLREPDWQQHRLLKRHDPGVNLHVFGPAAPEVDRLLLFRDRLRADPDELERYLVTKRELAARQWDQVQDYADAKTSVVEEIIARARTDPAR